MWRPLVDHRKLVGGFSQYEEGGGSGGGGTGGGCNSRLATRLLYLSAHDLSSLIIQQHSSLTVNIAEPIHRSAILPLE